MNASLLLTVFTEAKACLEKACGDDPRLCGMTGLINRMESSEEAMSSVTGCIPTHSTLLDAAIANMPEDQFAGLKAALTAAKPHLHWRVDQGLYYAEGADVGDGYRNGNMHALLIGPENSLIRADDFLLGFFLLAPHTLYRDHEHLAPELYLPLTGPHGWRFDQGAWEDHGAGQAIYNAPGVVHATRVYDVPFLALFTWTRDIGSACRVVPADDWADVEADLRRY